MRFLRLIILKLALVSNFQAFAEKEVIINQQESQYITSDDFSILEDSNNAFNVQYLALLPRNAFNFEVANFKKNHHQHLWLRLDINNKLATNDRWLLEIYNQRANELELYVFNDQGKYYSLDTIGSDIPFYKRSLINRFPLFEIPIRPGTNVIFIKYYSKHHLGLNAQILTAKSYINSANIYHFLIGGFYFVLLLLILYNLLFFISTRDQLYLYYCFFVFSAGLDCLRVDQMGFALLWPGFPQFNYYVDEYARTLFVFALVTYASNFLQISKLSVKLSYWIKSVLVVYTVQQIVFSEVFPSFEAALPISTVLLFILIGSIMYAAILKRKSAQQSVNLFLIGYSSISLGVIVTYLFYNGIIPGHQVVYFILFYGISIDTVMFSFALSARLKQERITKELALKAENIANQKVIIEMQRNETLLNKVNTELEAKVQERTVDLTLANAKLAEQAQIINQWNAQLDKTNWELNKEIKNLNTNRVLFKNPSYKEVLESFPSKLECLKFIANLKWPNGFVCRKCGNVKEIKTAEFLTKRCSKCGTIESVTANTLFHKLKFPIEKAFYLVYIVYVQKEQCNISEISREIDLNYKTCLHFSEKISEAILIHQKAGKKLKSWEEIVLDN